MSFSGPVSLLTNFCDFWFPILTVSWGHRERGGRGEGGGRGRGDITVTVTGNVKVGVGAGSALRESEYFIV